MKQRLYQAPSVSLIKGKPHFSSEINLAKFDTSQLKVMVTMYYRAAREDDYCGD